MTRIGTVDQVLLLLREQLQRSGRAGRAHRAGSAERSTAQPIDRVRALAALDTLSEEDMRKALIRGILVDAFGEGVGNDSALHALVDQVVRVIQDLPEGDALIERALHQLKVTSR